MTGPSFLLELTHRCNLSCGYCYGPWKAAIDYPRGELPTGVLVELLDRLIDDADPRSVTLIGGEPLLSSSLFPVATALTRRGVKVGLSTNGRLLDRAIVDELLCAGIGHFELSLDTIDSALYARMTGGNFDDVARAIGALKSRGAPCTLSAVLTRPVLPGLGDLILFACSWGVDSVSLLRPVGHNVAALVGELLPTDDELLGAMALASEMAEQNGLRITSGIPLEPCVFDRARFAHVLTTSCGGAKDKWAIDPMGNLRVCEASTEIVGSLVESRFAELSTSPVAERFRSTCLREDCPECRWFEQCRGGCRQARR